MKKIILSITLVLMTLISYSQSPIFVNTKSDDTLISVQDNTIGIIKIDITISDTLYINVDSIAFHNGIGKGGAIFITRSKNGTWTDIDTVHH